MSGQCGEVFLAHHCFAADGKCSINEQHEQRQYDGDTRKAQLLGNYRQQKIGVRFWEIEKFFNTSAESNTQPFTTPESNQRMRELIAFAIGIGPRVHESDDALQAVWRRNNQHHKSNRQQNDQSGKYAPVKSAQKQHCHGDGSNDDERTKIRLPQKHCAGKYHYRQHRQKALLEVIHERGFAYGVVCGVQHHEKFHQLRRLHADEANVDPAPRAIHLPADTRDQDQDQQQPAENKKRQCEPLPEHDRNLESDKRHHHTDDHENGMSHQVVMHAVAGQLLGFGHGDRRRINHHQTERQQQRHTPEQRHVELCARCGWAIEHFRPCPVLLFFAARRVHIPQIRHRDGCSC